MVEVPGKRGNVKRAVRCECRYEAIIRFQLPARYHAAKLSDFKPELVAMVEEWLKKPSDGLLLFGATGTGKTHLAAAIVRAVVERGKTIRFRRAAQLFQAIRDSYGSDVSEEEVLDEFIQTPMLVLDDLGTGSLSDHERRYTLEVLDRRLNASVPTIITSNWSIDQISSGMDERIGSRIAPFKLISFAGQDRRKSAKRKSA